MVDSFNAVAVGRPAQFEELYKLVELDVPEETTVLSSDQSRFLLYGVMKDPSLARRIGASLFPSLVDCDHDTLQRVNGEAGDIESRVSNIESCKGFVFRVVDSKVIPIDHYYHLISPRVIILRNNGAYGVYVLEGFADIYSEEHLLETSKWIRTNFFGNNELAKLCVEYMRQ